jgi:Sec-independent protein translocase protein TatA
MLRDLGEGLDNQLKQLMQRKQELSEVVAKQWNRTSQGGPEGMVVYRSLETTEFVFRDMATLVFGEKGPLGEAMSRLGKWAGESSRRAAARAPELEQRFRRTQEQEQQREALRTRHDQEIAPLERERERIDQMTGAAREAAHRRWEPRYEQLMRWQSRETDELEQKIEKERYEWCERDRKFQEGEVQVQAAALGAYNQALRETLTDFYTFTTPVIESAFSPSMGELLNIEREITVLTFLRNLAGQYEGLAGNAESVASLECFPPSDEEPPPEPEEPNVPKTKPWCPFKKPLKVKVMIISVEVDCEKFKLEGGELIVGSVERNFKKKETTIFLGAGANIGVTGLGGGAKIGGAITFQGDRVTNVAMESGVSSELGTVTTTLTGRVALEGGPDISLENTIGWGGTGIGNIQ